MPLYTKQFPSKLSEIFVNSGIIDQTTTILLNEDTARSIPKINDSIFLDIPPKEYEDIESLIKKIMDINLPKGWKLESIPLDINTSTINWFGKGCKYFCGQWEGYEDKLKETEPVLTFCNHGDNPNDKEGNCRPELCPLNLKPGKETT